MRVPKGLGYSIVFFDIETAPLVSYTWGIWEQNVVRVERDWYMLSFAVKHPGGKTEVFALPDFKLHKTEPDNDRELVKKLWAIFNEADMLVAHNGLKFDIKKANARFLFHGLTPPSPYKVVDTLSIARRHFALTSNKLDEVAKTLGIGRKKETGGFDLWLGCMRGDDKSWAKMKRYNAHDVVLLEKVYDRLRAWSPSHPNIAIAKGEGYCCPSCGGPNVQHRGWNYAKSFRSHRYQCLNHACGKWSSGKRERIPHQLLT